MVFGEVVTDERLSAVLVDALEDFIAGSVAQTGEEGGELGRNWG